MATVATTTQSRPQRAGRILGARIRMAHVQVAVALLALGLSPLTKPVDPDFWWHARTGQLILHHGIPRHDPYSWTLAGHAWVAHEWLSELLIYGVQSTLGYAANVVLFSACAVAAIALMYALVPDRETRSRRMVLLVILEAVMFIRFVTVRPQVFTWLFFALFVYVLERDSRARPARLWVLPIVMAFWANLHLGFTYGLLVVGVWALSVVVDRQHERSVGPRGALLLLGACIVASCLNPIGPELLFYPLRYMQDHSALTWISEWQRPNPLNPLLLPYWIALVLMAWALISRRRPQMFLLLLGGISIALGLEAIRNLPFAALLLLPIAGRLIPDRRDQVARSVPAVGAGLLLTTIAAAVVFAAASARGVSALRTAPDTTYPAAGAEVVRSLGPGHRLFNDYGWGGYLIARLYPDTPVFIDGRTDFYRAGLIEDYETIANARPGWQVLMARYKIDEVLVASDSKLAQQLRTDAAWRTAYGDDHEVVLVRGVRR